MIDTTDGPIGFDVIERVNGCEGCYFKKDGIQCIRNDTEHWNCLCVSERRKDGFNVIFMKRGK